MPVFNLYHGKKQCLGQEPYLAVMMPRETEVRLNNLGQKKRSYGARVANYDSFTEN